ncbi:hypothetical protein ACFQ1E_17270 [Sphingomonas canadensis]|uniref:Tip attachment protein J domain-containing protein n=1 Tax=Sphingomonas canadensis TaxID=1219257 RepID=A0ABW3HF05_9SPHN|nr:hypothetical protein [Sphingomonas canadensis]MCW3837798.1 hypothetical protein [Sphingomonas canadensis]
MSKALKIAGFVLAVAAAIPTGGTSLLAATGIGAVAASALVLGVNFAAAMTASGPSVQGQQTQWRADINAGVPIVFGRTLVGGDLRYKKSHGKNNKYDTIVTVLSGCGPVNAIAATYADKKAVSYSGAAATGELNGRLWSDFQLGACPEASQLSTGIGTPPGWSSAHKLSGYAAVMDTFEFDGKGENTFTQIPAMARLMEGVKGYSARDDSTFDGGSGTQRWDDETTWAYTENPFDLAATYAIGWHQGPDDVRVGGVGMNISAIDRASFADAAAVADYNGWVAGGQVTSRDGKWEVLKALCQAGGGEPVRQGALLSCIVEQPRVALATITSADVIGECSIATSQPRRDRLNGIVPRYRSEDHFWEIVPASLVKNEDWIAEDGGERTRELDMPLVQCPAGEQPAQAAQVAAYHLARGREAGPIVLPLRLRWMGFRAGDCLQVANEPFFGWLAGKKVLVLRRRLDAEAASIVLTLRTETDSKHAWALAQTGTAAPVTDLPEFELSPPEAGEWTVDGATIEGDGSAIPALVFEGAVPDGVPTGVVFSIYQGEAAPVDPADWEIAAVMPPTTTRFVYTSVGAGLPYVASVQYRYAIGISERLVLGPVTTGVLAGTTAAPFAALGGELLTYGGEYITFGG